MAKARRRVSKRPRNDDGDDALEYVRLVAHNVRAVRRALGWTQEEAADRLGLDVRALSRVENAVLDLRLTTLRKLARGLGVRPGRLLRSLPARR